MKTRLGLFLRNLRIANNEVLLNMAQKLGVTSPFLSNVENCKKPMPEDMFGKIVTIYKLTAQQIDELRTAMIEAGGALKLNLEHSSASNRELAVVFARKFNKLDEETSRKMIAFLNKHKGENR